MAGNRVQLTSPNERRTLLAATTALHLAALALLLLIRPVLPALADQPILRVFDIPVVPPDALPDPAPLPKPTKVGTAGGGSPRTTAAVRSTAKTSATPAVADATVMIDAPAIVVPDLQDLGASAIGASAFGTGDGEGAGTGQGNGPGSGPGSRPATLRAAAWIRKPTDAEFLRAWPTGALVGGVSGRVVLACRVDDRGRTRNCKVVNEAPVGKGFGRAALSLSLVFRVRPVTRDDQAVDLPVIIPLYFEHRRSR